MARLNFGLFGYRFKTKDGLLTYKSAYGKSAVVRISDIDTVTTDTAKGMGKAKLKIIGRGATLAEITLPRPWVEKAQMFILKQLPERNNQ
ncbi:MAG: hypothetical protein ABIQ64_01010 [Candidatus Saccharimonadales bacterium]